MAFAGSLKPFRLLFVCSGNICRSPLAEAIFNSLAREAAVGPRFMVDSAGTHGLHEGDPADPRPRRVGRRHGLSVDSIARPVVDGDFDRFDLIIAMDRSHEHELLARRGTRHAAAIRLMLDFDVGATDQDVPDPYYGAEDGFEALYSRLVPACQGLLKTLCT